MSLISIITPSFNQGAYIEETIKSVLTQDYPNIEYWVIDGGSTDETLQILNRYKDRLSYISEKDSGQAEAISKGFRRASGDIFYWINSDDTLLPGTVSKVMESFNTHPNVALIYGQSHFIDAKGNTIGRYPSEPFHYERLAMFDFIPQPSAFFARKAFESINGLDQNLTYGMDYDLWIRLTKKYPVYYLPEFMSTYRLHPLSKTVDMDQALANCKEIMEIAYHHYNWAPANRVYGYYNLLVEARVKKYFKKTYRPVTLLLALLISTIKYILINKKIHPADIRAINIAYLKKIATRWNDLYKTY